MKKLAVLALLLPGVQALAGDPLIIDQKNRAFSVREVHIQSGDTVRFNNNDEFGHQVYTQSPNFSFDTDESDPGKQVDVRFPVRGDYHVLCHIHPRMRLDVHVD